MMDDDNDNVIHLVQPKSEEEKLLNVSITDRKSTGQKYCKHSQTKISEVNRTLICLQCGSMLDPFDLILERARNAENIVFEIKRLYARCEELRESVASLEREEKNAKARLRSARTSILFAENDLKNVEQGVKQ